MTSTSHARFLVVPPKRSLPKGKQKKQFVLQQDNWNDFNFQTQYQLYATGTGGEYELIGSVKILKRGQTKEDGLQINRDFVSLDKTFCSLGQSLDYYQRLGQLPRRQRDQILKSLRDVVQFPELEQEFSVEPGWNTSIVRDFKKDPHFQQLARSLLTGNFSSLVNINDGFSFHCPNWTKALEFRFDVSDSQRTWQFWHSSSPSDYLPARLCVVVGRNASGKSTLLARLARVAYATQKERETKELSRLGRFDPPGIGFPRIITVSYSAFDSFQIPGTDQKGRAQSARDVEKGAGRFIYCGLRDIASEFTANQSPTRDKAVVSKPTVANDRVTRTLLKPINKLAGEFDATITRIKRLRKTEVFHTILQDLLKEASFNDIRNDLLTPKPKYRELFLSWSTGHKIVLQVISSLVAYTEPRSLVLIDEPETHLHPPLLAAFIHSVRNLLKKQDAIGVIATHSPVVLQETLGQHVWIIRREGAVTDVSLPSTETFGENIGALTEHVFGLTSESTDFHEILKRIATRSGSLQDIEKIFQPHGLSMQARAYVMSILAGKKK